MARRNRNKKKTDSDIVKVSYETIELGKKDPGTGHHANITGLCLLHAL